MTLLDDPDDTCTRAMLVSLRGMEAECVVNWTRELDSPSCGWMCSFSGTDRGGCIPAVRAGCLTTTLVRSTIGSVRLTLIRRCRWHSRRARRHMLRRPGTSLRADEHSKSLLAAENPVPPAAPRCWRHSWMT